jgi:hypothetical protein
VLYAAYFGTRGPDTVGELLAAVVDAVVEAIRSGDSAAIAYFTNWHPGRNAARFNWRSPEGTVSRTGSRRSGRLIGGSTRCSRRRPTP